MQVPLRVFFLSRKTADIVCVCLFHVCVCVCVCVCVFFFFCAETELSLDKIKGKKHTFSFYRAPVISFKFKARKTKVAKRKDGPVEPGMWYAPGMVLDA